MNGGAESTINPGNTLFSPLGTGWGQLLSGGDADLTHVKIYEAGTISLLGYNLITNPSTPPFDGATVTVTVLKNDVPTDLEVSAGPGETGYLLNSTDSIDVAPGDTINVRYTHSNVFEFAATGNMTSVLFTPADSSVCVTQAYTNQYSAFIGISFGTTRYVGLHGLHSEGSTDQQERQDCIPIACTAQNARVRITANTCNGATTCTLQKNGVDTAVVVTFAVGESGWKEDVTHTATFAPEDRAGWKIQTAGSSGGITFQVASVQFYSDSGEFFLGLGNQTRTPPGTTTDLGLSGINYNLDTEADQQWQATIGGFAIGLCINITANSAGSDSTLAWRNGGVDGNNIVVIPAGETGFFDVSASDPWLIEDLLHLRLTIPGGGQITFTTINVGLSFELGRGVIGPYAWIECRRRIP